MVNDENESPPLPAVAQTRIGQKLRTLYDTFANEPVPDRFKELLNDLQQAHTKVQNATPVTAQKAGGAKGEITS